MKTTFLKKLLLCVVTIGALSSCSLDSENDYVSYPQPEAAYGIIANASPASGDLFFFADANKINDNALTFATAAGYYNFTLGNRILAVKNASGTTLATKAVTLTRGQSFTAFAVNTFNNIEIVTYRDSLTSATASKAYVRFINLSPDAAPINITGTTQTFATGLAFKQATPFIEVSGGNYDFTYKATATQDTLAQDRSVALRAGKIYTIYTKGFTTPPTGSNDTFSTKVIPHN
ncbi:hypothetical protein Q765_06075 [Flavobacterium rivuli WB 3.3-2 = DSM 21788]|uniref:DUF4397 domain-containing protein n=1 Tax=Flavobacterium rivuli WB 3.3-2 = DSM 21788 TaxID=1121895 RepID=A0A0A2M735_9FLAO|nr:DUF4397 domain-containing protein [Flavobacterium rivuli]KGO87233.1 hypothetical protein Q765_06075 [Flavobacterium rivuli WB 3.3-2 = DSM 21788]